MNGKGWAAAMILRVGAVKGKAEADSLAVSEAVESADTIQKNLAMPTEFVR